MDFGIVNSCECSEEATPCKKCADDKPFIHKISIRVVPKLPAGATVENVLGKPENSPQTVEATKRRSVSWQIPFLNPTNATTTPQFTETVSVKYPSFGWAARIAPNWKTITFIWELSTWKGGHKLNFSQPWLPFFRDLDLPVDPRHTQVHPESLSKQEVHGKWHVKSPKRSDLDEVAFHIELTIYPAVSKKRGRARFVKQSRQLKYVFSDVRA